MSCRLPGAPDLAAYWRLLEEGRDAIVEVPPDRWDLGQFYHPDPAHAGTAVTRWGGFLEGLERFDAAFFGITPREAVQLDPRQRLALELSWEALEDAGIVPSSLARTRTGVFVATLTDDYGDLMFDDILRVGPYSGSGAANTVVANRISYFLDLVGPSIALDTACSGSLVAIHLACQSLRCGESEIAFAGGVNLNFKPQPNLFFSKAGALSPTGRCRAFDASADGIVRSDGAGFLVLKTVDQAIADGDHIRAVIRGSAVNSDGQSNGLMAPNSRSQTALLEEAYRYANLAPGEVQYVEAHGTGTRLGDPIEVSALGEVLARGRRKGEVCRIGSVKSNIGHTEAAAGVAGVIKTVLSLQKRALPPSLHFSTPNPLIPFERIPIEVQTKLGPWPHSNRPLVAGVSGFGFGGTNAHVVLEEFVAARAEAPSDRPGPYLVVLSAQTPQAREELVRGVASIDRRATIEEMASASALERAHLDWRLAALAGDRLELDEHLRGFLAGEDLRGLASSPRPVLGQPRTAFVFSGQGSHWAGMGSELLRTEPVFRDALERADASLAPWIGFSIVERIVGPEPLERTDIVQPAVFAIQIALAELWRNWGIEPSVVVGQSLGEVAAACVAGAIRLEDAARVVAVRSRLMQRAEGLGKTALIELPLDQAQLALIGFEELDIAGSIGPMASVIAGEPEAIDRLVASLSRRGVLARLVNGVGVAFHSRQMDSLRAELEMELEDLRSREGTLPIVSSVDSEFLPGSAFDGRYWGRNLREPFRFAEAVRLLVGEGIETFVEISAHPVLAPEIEKCLLGLGRRGRVVSSLRRNRGERGALLAALGALYTAGWNPRWERLHLRRPDRPVLPSYPWQRERYWLRESGEAIFAVGRTSAASLVVDSGHPLLGLEMLIAGEAGRRLWQREISAELLPDLAQHRIAGAFVMPGAAYLEMALEAAERELGRGTVALADVEFVRKLTFGEAEVRLLQMSLLTRGREATFEIFSRGGSSASSPWTLHARGRVKPFEAAAETGIDISSVRARCGEERGADEHLAAFRAQGLDYGPIFRWLERIWRRQGESLVSWRRPNEATPERTARYRIHPALLDAVLQAAAPVIEKLGFLPVGLKSLEVFSPLGDRGWFRAVMGESGELRDGILKTDLEVLDEGGRLLARLTGLAVKDLAWSGPNPDPSSWFYLPTWLPSATPSSRPRSDGFWMILADEGGVGSKLGKMLEAAGGRARVIAFDAIDPGPEPDSFQTLLGAYLSEPSPCVGIVDLRCLGSSVPGGLGGTDLVEGVIAGPLSALGRVRTLASSRSGSPPRIWLVTRGAQAINAESPDPSAAALWGLARVVALEHFDLFGGVIDLDPEGSEDEQAAALLDEISVGGGETQVAVRGRNRFVARLMPAREDEVFRSLLRLRVDGAYLVTGGLGGLGLAVARRLVERGARRLILIGRTPLPPREQWSSLPTASPTALRVAEVRHLESLGASVSLETLDIADEAALAGFLERYRSAGWPPICGVVHAAGVIRDRLIANMDREELTAVLRPKIAGAWNLDRLLRAEDLDFFVLFSSLSAVTGNRGQAAYAAANAFLDALAWQRKSRGVPANSINWGPWSEVGMAAELPSSLIPLLSPSQGLAAFELLVGGDHTQAVVVPVTPDGFSRLADQLGGRMLAELGNRSKAPASEAATSPRLQWLESVRAAAPDERADRVERRLVDIMTGVLGFSTEGLDRERPLISLGLDSIMATELKSRVEGEVGVAIPIGSLLSGISATSLIDLVLESLVDGVSEPVAESVVHRIERVSRDANLPLSYSQHRHWFLHHLEPESALLTEFGVVEIAGLLDLDHLYGALEDLGARHESLRAAFPSTDDGQPLQVILERVAPPFSLVDLRSLSDGVSGTEARRCVQAEVRRPFAIDRAPLWRSVAVRLAFDRNLLLIAHHHIISDGFSTGILSRDLSELYNSRVEKRSADLPVLTIQFADFASWQRAWLDGPELEKHLSYWRRELAGARSVLRLPWDHPRPEIPDYRGGRHPVSLDAGVVEALRASCLNSQTTLFTALTAGYFAWLHVLSGDDDITVGIPAINRDRPEVTGVVGCFVNALPLRIDLSGDPTFIDLVARVGAAVRGALEHQDLPFERLVEEINPERHRSHWPLFQVVFNYRGDWLEPPRFGNLASRLIDLEDSLPTKYDVTLYLGSEQDRLIGELAYRVALFEPSTVARICEVLTRLLEQVALRPQLRLSELNLVSDGERERMTMDRAERDESNLKKLMGVRRKAVKVSASDMVETGYLEEGQTLPLVVRPAVPDADLCGWASGHLDVIERHLLAHGGLLFRGFQVPNPEIFEQFCRIVTPDLVNYMEGSSPRIMVTDRVYTSTEYPPEYFVSLHNELSYAHRWPSRIMFFCLVEPQGGGQTPIADSRRVLAELSEGLRRRFLEKGLLYVRRLRGGKGAGLSWQTVFETEDGEVVERYCREGGIEFVWESETWLRTRQRRPAIVRHPSTGELLWFNQADQFHPSNLGEEMARSLIAATGEEDLPINAYFGDGTPLDPAELDEVRAAFRKVMVVFPWRQGDILLLDNMLVAHGRMPFSGPRKVMVAMGAPVALSDVVVPRPDELST